MAERKRRYQDPKQWAFNQSDHDKYTDQEKNFWKLPQRLVGTRAGDEWEPGLLARIWRAEGTSRGGGAASSILPVLAFHSFPGMGVPKDRQSDGEWTGWRTLSYRQIAALSGLGKDTVGAAFDQLAKQGLLQSRRQRRTDDPRGGALFRHQYRLRASEFFPAATEDRFVRFPADLLYAGVWALLPTNASRHLYLVIACVDWIADEEAYLNSVLESAPGAFGSWDQFARDDIPWQGFEDTYGEYAEEEKTHAIQADLLAEQRARHPTSIATLVRLSGMSKSVVMESLRILTEPIFGEKRAQRNYPPIPLVLRGETEGNLATWYALNRRAWGWGFHDDGGRRVLNEPEELQRTRRRMWPWLFERRKTAQKRAAEREFWTFDGQSVDTEGMELAESLARHDLAPWEESQALVLLQRRLEAAGRPASGADLGRLVKLNEVSVTHALRIARELPAEAIERSGITEDDLHRLARAALIEIADAQRRGVETQASMLQRAVADQRFTTRRTAREAAK